MTLEERARDPETPPEVLAELAGDGDEDVRWSVAGNRWTPPEVLARLAGDENTGVRQGVARNPGTPPEVLAALAVATLAGDRDWGVRRCVAENPVTPHGVLARLARDGDREVRAEAVRGWLGRVLAISGAVALYAALGEDPLSWDEARQRQLLRGLGEDA